MNLQRRGVSIIVPVYNAAKYLHKCINSVQNQTFTDWELLLIDDGSTDESLAICQSYACKDGRISVFAKKNGGVSSARNVGIQNATCDSILFLDSDDTLPANSLMDLYNTDRADLIIGSVVSEERTIAFPVTPQLYQGQQLADLLDLYLNDHMLFKSVWAKLYKSDIIKKYNIKFNTSLCLGEDTVFLTEYLMHIDNLLIVFNTCYNYNYDATNSYAAKYSKKGFKPLYDFYLKQTANYKNIAARFGLEGIVLKPDFIFDVAKEILINPRIEDQHYIYKFLTTQTVFETLKDRKSLHVNFILTLVKRKSFVLLKAYLKVVNFIKKSR